VLDSTGGRSAQGERRGGTETQRSGDRADRAPRREAAGKRSTPEATTPAFVGPYASAGPYERDGGAACEVRLERVPGGLRLGEWVGAELEPRASVLAVADLGVLVEAAHEAGALEREEYAWLAAAVGEANRGGSERSADPAPAAYGASPGRSGELRDELRVEALGGGRARVARWVLRPGTGWDLVDAPTILPARRYADALADAARKGVLAA